MRRLAANVKAQDLAKAIGVTASTFSKWELEREAVPKKHLTAWRTALRERKGSRT